MDNEENRGLIYQKDFEDQLVLFVSSVLELSHYSLYLSLSLSHTHTHTHLDTQNLLEHFGIGSSKGIKQEEGGRKKGGEGIKKLQQDTWKVSICMCIIHVRYGMHSIACGSFLFWHGCDSVFTLSLPFSDSHGVVEFSCLGLDGLPDEFEGE